MIGFDRNILIRSIQCGLALLLIVAPFPLGSVPEGWILFLEIATCLLVLLWVIAQLAAGEVTWVKNRFTWPLALLIAYIALTLAPLPRKVVETLSPQAAEAYGATAEAVSTLGSRVSVPFRISLVPFETEAELLKLAMYILFFLLVLNVSRYSNGFMYLYKTLAILGAAVAVIGIAQLLGSIGKIHWKYRSGNGSPFWPFLGREQFAGYIELCLGLALGLFLAEVQRLKNPKSASGKYSWLRRPTKDIFFWASFIMIAALGACFSTAGIFSFACAAVVFIARALLRRPGRKPMLIMLTLLSLVTVLVAALSIRSWSVAAESAAHDRIGILRDGARAVMQFPLTGSGLGSFCALYPRYKSGNLPLQSTYAENEYLQWVIETGLVGLVLLGLAAGAFAKHALFRLRTRKDAYMRALALGALCAVLMTIVHNWTSFNTHVPSNALTFSAVAALALVVVNSHRGHQGDRFLLQTVHHPIRSLTATALISAMLLGTALLAWRSWAHYQVTKLEIAAGQDARGASPLDASVASWNGTPHFRQALAYETEARRESLVHSARVRSLLARAEDEILQAIASNPIQGSYWAMLGRVEDGLHNRSGSERAFRRALVLDHTNGYIHRDYGLSLVLNGQVQAGAARFTLARSYNPAIGLQDLLEILSSHTTDRRVWESIVRYQPQDLNVYAAFLQSHGFGELGDQIRKQAKTLTH